MDGLSVLYALSPAINAELYKQGNAHGWLAKSAADVASHYLSGRLYIAKSGWLLLSVPNALVRGVFDAMTDAGVELPLAGVMNVPNVDKELLNAHISVMTAAEAEKIGAGNINERGHSFRYSLGPVKEITPKNIDGVSKIWAIQVSSPDLSALRKSYGLSALPKDEPFHITVAVRRTKVLGNNGVSKGYETSAEPAEGHSFRNPVSRGALKAASAETTYECNCSGRCTCPDTCVCKKSCCAGSSKTAADLLPGGASDNMPDSKFPKKELAIGVADEREHTSNDQIASEIAKDHLQENPTHYEKEKLNQKEAQPAIILKLREAKQHSDNKRYDKKNEILRKLMTQAPDEWFVDDPLPHHMGITHAPTSFRFHADPGIIPVGVKVKAKAASSNPYWDQITNFSQAPVIDKSKSIWQNFFGHLKTVAGNADRQFDMQQNDHKWRAELIPGYREQMNMAIARGEFPQTNQTAEFLRNTATPALNAVS